MKKTMFLVALLAIPAIAFAGTASMSLKNNADGSTLATVGPAGGTINVAVNIDTVAGAPEGVSNFDGTIVASVGSVFTITARTLVGCAPFTSSDIWGTTNDTNATTGLYKVLNTASKSIGAAAAASNYMPGSPALPWKVEIITMTVAAGPVRTMTLDFSPSSFVGTTIDGIDPDTLVTALSGMTVNQTPEPATMLLLAAAVPFLRRRSA